MHELPLVLFTVFAQTSVGIALFAIIGLLLNKLSLAIYKKALFLSIFALSIGGIASLFHLGQPLRAANVLMGIGRSPMSNEVFATILFGMALSSTLLMLLLKKSQTVVKFLGVLTGIMGMIFITVIPTIYQIDTIPQWNNVYTPLQMILTALTVGSVIMYALSKDKLFSYLSVITLAISLVILPSYFMLLNNVLGSVDQAITLWWTLKIAGISVVFYLVLKTKLNTMLFSAVATLLVISSELSGRISFFELWNISM